MNELVGVWKTDPTDNATLEIYGEVTMEFTNDGRLIYTIHEEDREQIILMTYSIEGNRLITDQPSAPSKEETIFRLDRDELELDYGGVIARYVRAR